MAESIFKPEVYLMTDSAAVFSLLLLKIEANRCCFHIQKKLKPARYQSGQELKTKVQIKCGGATGTPGQKGGSPYRCRTHCHCPCPSSKRRAD